MQKLFISFLCVVSFSAYGFDSIDDVIRVVRDENIKTVDELLERGFPEGGKEKTLSPALIFRSRGTQKATPQAPRVVFMHDPSGYEAYSTEVPAPFFLAINGSDQVGGNNVEMIQYRPESGEYEFRKVEFDPTGYQAPIISKKNPSNCFGCHGQPLRPIWDSYGLWPMVYGGGHLQFNDKQKVEFQSFMAFAKTDPRYKVIYKTRSLEKYGVFSGENPVQVLGEAIGRSTFHRMALELSQKSELRPYRYAVIGGLMGCDFRKLFTDSAWLGLESKNSFESVLKDTYERNKSYLESRLASHLENLGEGFKADFPKFSTLIDGTYYGNSIYHFPARLRFILEPMGVDFIRWKTRPTGSYLDYDFHFGYSTPGSSFASFFVALAFPSEEQARALEFLDMSRRVRTRDKACAETQELSRAAMEVTSRQSGP